MSFSMACFAWACLVVVVMMVENSRQRNPFFLLHAGDEWWLTITSTDLKGKVSN
uniref:Uncharacterized protein n=1 Tax=Rhizophora mucronata TaxID=61149 RepID=A0A2P2PYG0_RHIMU